jgi:hypothetical protein
MLSLPGLIGLIAYILIRPFDLMPSLKGVPFLYIFFALAVLGFLLDLAQGRLQFKSGLQLKWVIGLTVWALMTVLVRAPSTIGEVSLRLLISTSLYFLIAHGVSDFRALSRLSGVFLACTFVVSVTCVYQGLQPFQCVAREPNAPSAVESVPDGRGCNSREDCYDESANPELGYGCERVGIAGICSLGHGRVRYVGVLHDPNEAALAVAIGVPIAIARYQQRRQFSRLITLVLTFVFAGTTVIMSGSRGGLLVFLTVLAAYFVSRYRWKGVVVAVLLALPVLILGGRDKGDGDASTEERFHCLWAGIQMFKSHPLLGVGHGQFTEHHGQTAHNSYVLAPAELGIVGMAMWAMVFWISIKVTYVGLKRSSSVEHPDARVWGFALFATLVGLAVGVAFLTFNYHFVLWITFGLAGAYHRSVVREQPDITVHVGTRDLAFVTLGNLALLIFLYFYIQFKGMAG